MISQIECLRRFYNQNKIFLTFNLINCIRLELWSCLEYAKIKGIKGPLFCTFQNPSRLKIFSHQNSLVLNTNLKNNEHHQVWIFNRRSFFQCFWKIRHCVIVVGNTNTRECYAVWHHSIWSAWRWSIKEKNSGSGEIEIPESSQNHPIPTIFDYISSSSYLVYVSFLAVYTWLYDSSLSEFHLLEFIDNFCFAWYLLPFFHILYLPIDTKYVQDFFLTSFSPNLYHQILDRVCMEKHKIYRW